MYALCEHYLIFKQEKLHTHTQNPPVPYPISKNKSTYHEECNKIIIPIVIFVMAYLIVYKDPTQNKTQIFHMKNCSRTW